MNLNMNMENDFNKTSVQGVSRTMEQERSFKLSLQTFVTGKDASGHEIRERTRITSISSERAIFLLKSKTVISTPLFLMIDIPQTLILHGPLNLFLSGKVVLVTKQKKQNIQSVTLDLKQSYKIHSQTLSNPA